MDRRHLWLIPLVLFVLFLGLKPRAVGYGNEAAVGESAALTLGPGVAVPVSGMLVPAPIATSTPPIVTALSATPLPDTLAAPPTPTDEPALVPELAPPTPAPALTETVVPSQPARLVIPAIGLDMEPVAVGLDEKRIPVVPKHDVGWYDRSATPGQNSNVVFWGHVLRWQDAPEIPAPFERVHELQPGAELIIVTADGRERNYRVTEQIQVRPDQVEYIDPTPSERVTLVSCIGDKLVVDGTLTKEFRLLTIAEPAG